MKLNRQDFDIFDNLIRRIGFGSYYDLIQCLKDAIRDIDKKHLIKCEKLQKETDLLTITNILNQIIIKYKKQLTEEAEEKK